jgi:hypothetical protein
MEGEATTGGEGGGESTGSDLGSTATGGGEQHAAEQAGYREKFQFTDEDMRSLEGEVDLGAGEQKPAADTKPVAEVKPAVEEKPVVETAATETKTGEEAAAKEEAATPALADAATLELLAPLLEDFTSPEEGADKAETFYRNLQVADPGKALSLANAIFDVRHEEMTQWALNELGIGWEQAGRLKENAKAIDTWLASGAKGDLPAFDEPKLEAPDEFGIVEVEAGSELQKILGDDTITALDLNKPGDKAAYSTAKQVFDRNQQDQRAQREAARKQEESTANAAEVEADQREQTFSKGRVDCLKTSLAALNLNYGDDKDAVTDLHAMIEYAVLHDGELHKLDASGSRLARDGGKAIATVQQQMDDRIKSHIDACVQRQNTRMLNAARVERGAHATDPVVTDVKKVSTTDPTRQSPPENRPPVNIDQSIRDIDWEKELAAVG